jgi:hypothetical protein
LWAQAKGSGWSLIDVSALSAIQMLYLVEFANNNSQAMIGRGYVDGNSAKLSTGSCDVVPNLTGRPAGTDGKTDIVYRGIEGIWGNLWEFVDGVNFFNGAYYVCNDPAKYADDTQNGYDAVAWIYDYYVAKYITINSCGDGSDNYVMLPYQAGGSEATGYCDTCWAASGGGKVCARGGGWDVGSTGGLFTMTVSNASGLSGSDIGSRLIYIPQ